MPSASLESRSGVKHEGKPSGGAAGPQPCVRGELFCWNSSWASLAAVPCCARSSPACSEQPPGLMWEQPMAGWQPQHLFACPRGAPARGYPKPPSPHPAGCRQRSIAPHSCIGSSRHRAPQRQVGKVFWGSELPAAWFWENLVCKTSLRRR